jgi:hypothetical protein
MLWSLQRSYLPIRPFFKPHAVWYVSYLSFSRSWLRFVPFIYFGNRVHSGCDRSTWDTYSSMAPAPTSDIFRGPCTPILWYVFPIGLWNWLLFVIFCHFIRLFDSPVKFLTFLFVFSDINLQLVHCFAILSFRSSSNLTLIHCFLICFLVLQIFIGYLVNCLAIASYR